MRLYVFHDAGLCTNQFVCDLKGVLEKVAETTDTHDLVVAAYLRPGEGCGGELASTRRLSHQDFCRGRRRWPFIDDCGTPEGLPGSFFLIRLKLGVETKRLTRATYGWEIRFGHVFFDEVAYLFGHELHHFRRYGLGLHPREGERSACRWGVQRAQEAGFAVQGHPVRIRRKRRTAKREIRVPIESNKTLLRRIQARASRLAVADLQALNRWIQGRLTAVADQSERSRWEAHYETLRLLPEGATVVIGTARTKEKYLGQTATKLRTLTRNSDKMAIRTSDGKVWHWPMRWLEVPR